MGATPRATSASRTGSRAPRISTAPRPRIPSAPRLRKPDPPSRGLAVAIRAHSAEPSACGSGACGRLALPGGLEQLVEAGELHPRATMGLAGGLLGRVDGLPAGVGHVLGLA